MVPRVLVIGYGSLLRCDDAAGRVVAETIASWNLPRVQCRSVHQLTPELAEELARVPFVLFVDAQVGEPRDRPELAMVAANPSQNASSFCHFMTPSGLLNLARLIYERVPESWLLTVPVVDMELGDTISPTAKTAIDAAIVLAREFLAETEGSPRLAR